MSCILRHLERPHSWLPVSKAMQRARPAAAPATIVRKSHNNRMVSYENRTIRGPGAAPAKIVRKSYENHTISYENRTTRGTERAPAKIVRQSHENRAASYENRTICGPEAARAKIVGKSRASRTISYHKRTIWQLSSTAAVGPKQAHGGFWASRAACQAGLSFHVEAVETAVFGPKQAQGLLGFVVTLLSSAEIVR